ncbi:MAG: peptidoglycan DD-metalloendopeptidase family protein [Patescibacteria group bacterium]
MHKFLKLICVFLLGLFFLSIFSVPRVHADLIEDLKSKIDERNKVIKDLEVEIAQYQSQVEKTSTEGKTLKSKIAALELTRKKLSAEISSLENKIASANLSIQKLNIQISDSETSIKKSVQSISNTLAETDEEESTSLVETLLTYKSISSFLDRVETLGQLNESLNSELAKLKTLKSQLEDSKLQSQKARDSLVTLADSLTDKKKVAEYNKTQTNKLLVQTKSQEEAYRKILAQKQALRDSFEKELLSFESQLKFAIDPSSLPQTGSGVLKWPLDKVRITQQFGDTDFARSHVQAYNGRGHNGIDLAASIGTPVKSALSGKVLGTGNTDTACPNASYGKWVLIDHHNGLTTLYAHLSVIKVSAGQEVQTGEIIGYSGETGYATGPHLHFTVYASQGVEIVSRPSKSCNATYIMPVGSLNAYLNPLLYL